MLVAIVGSQWWSCAPKSQLFGSRSCLGNQSNGSEAATREAIYNIAIAEMEAHNAVKSQTYTQGVNRSTDLTLEEFQALPIRGYIAGAKSGLPKLLFM